MIESERDEMIKRLKAENEELLEWKQGKRGVEDYFTALVNLNTANAMNAVLRFENDKLKEDIKKLKKIYCNIKRLGEMLN